MFDINCRLITYFKTVHLFFALAEIKYLYLHVRSGVLFDPRGLDRFELNRLAQARLCVSSFNKKLLSFGGFFVSIDAKGI